MTEQQKWEAVQKNDARFDGMLFYAVKSTGIFCRPSCKSKPPKRENVVFFDDADEAQKAGYRPCKRCRSDLPDYLPERELARRVKALIDESCRRGEQLQSELNTLGFPVRRLAEAFRDEYGVSVREYINTTKLHRVQRMLVEGKAPVIEIAFAAGFESVASFYRFFKLRMGMSPTAYRKAEEGK